MSSVWRACWTRKTELQVLERDTSKLENVKPRFRSATTSRELLQGKGLPFEVVPPWVAPKTAL